MFILGKKAELTTSNDIKGVHEKNCSAMTRSMVETGKFYIKLYMFIFTKEKSPPPPQVFLSETLFLSKTWILFSMEFHSHCCLFIQKRFIFDFFLPCLFVFIIFFPEHQNTIKFINFITYGRAIHLLHI